jgi:hypothetical protein
MCVAGISEIQDPGRRDGIAEPLRTSLRMLSSCIVCGGSPGGGDLTAVLVGQTQSNMSAPRAMHTIRSSGYPTPMT